MSVTFHVAHKVMQMLFDIKLGYTMIPLDILSDVKFLTDQLHQTPSEPSGITGFPGKVYPLFLQKEIMLGALSSSTHFDALIWCAVGEKDDSLPVLWLAPESILECKFTEATEVYSQAKGCYEVLCHGVHPHTSHINWDTEAIIRYVCILGCFYSDV